MGTGVSPSAAHSMDKSKALVAKNAVKPLQVWGMHVTPSENVPLAWNMCIGVSIRKQVVWSGERPLHGIYELVAWPRVKAGATCGLAMTGAPRVFLFTKRILGGGLIPTDKTYTSAKPTTLGCFEDEQEKRGSCYRRRQKSSKAFSL